MPLPPTPFGTAVDVFEAPAEEELTKVYSNEPRNTMLAPTPSSVFHPFPNHHTLKHRLSALRVVRTRLVDTLETRLKR